jgi:hypothetical protein
MANIDINKAQWQEKFDEYEDKMVKEKFRLVKRPTITIQ